MSTPLRVLAVGTVYPPHHLGGYEIIWQGAMRQLRQASQCVRVLTTDHRGLDVPADAPEDPDVNRELWWYWRDHQWRSLGPAASLRLERHNAAVFDRHVKEFQPDVITWWPVGGLSLGLIERARRARIPAVLFVLDPWPVYAPRHDRWMRLWRRSRSGHRRIERLTGLTTRVDCVGAGRWVFCSEAMRAQTLAALPNLTDGTVIQPGVESEYLTAATEAEPPAWRWQLLYAGRVVEQKGVRTAVESLALLPTAARLTIVGDGDRDYRYELERLAERLGVRDRLRFEAARPRAELPDVYRAADAIVFPVWWEEPWGLVPLEAMAMGRPVVATGRGGSGEYLHDRVNALLFEARNARSLAAAVTRLADDPELRDRLRAGGRRTAVEHSAAEFNRRAMAEIEAAASGSRGSGH
jgi:glycogen synthase